MNKFYITTAIVYGSSRPHIGNVYELIYADAIARFKRLLGYDVYFQTGIDEHGQKIEMKAKEQGLKPQDYVDNIVKQIKEEWDALNPSYDSFIRTTDPKHKQKVQAIFKKLYEQGDIYLGKYEGHYCTPCESFFAESQLVDEKCPDCGRPVTKTGEEAYFLKLNKYVEQLIKHIEDNPGFIYPESRRNEMVNNFLKPGLQDLCVSRTSINWGIPVSFDDKHIIYVWIDALSNYITFLDYNADGESGILFNKYWPADVHVIGKDIVRFHAIYWPIILMALNVPLPKKILGHSWLLNNNDKMSKSKGNAMYASELVKHFDVDAIRFYLLHETNINSDGVITYELLIERTNSELVNNLGNLLNRTLNMIKQYFNGAIPKQNKLTAIDKAFIEQAIKLPKQVEGKVNNYQISDALDDIFKLFSSANKYIEETAPWTLAKNEDQNAQLQTVIYNLAEAIRFGAVLLHPFLPTTAAKILEQLNTTSNDWDSLTDFSTYKFKDKINQPQILFARIDKEKKLNEIEVNYFPGNN
ncbi:MAG: methionine--tRNA ligase [Bacilli bacterium]